VIRDNPLSQTPECRALLDLATPNLYRVNAFRILGIDVTATLRDSAKQVERRRMLAELGQADTMSLGRLELIPPPTVEDLRAADAVIHNAEARLIHEFFWFWPLDPSGAHNDPTLKALRAGDHKSAFKMWGEVSKDTAVPASMVAIARHNLAVSWHMTALDREVKTTGHCWDSESDDDIEKTWTVALKYWKSVISADALWNALSARVIALDDERLSLEFVQSLREAVTKALVKVNTSLAFKYAESGQCPAATSHMSLILKSGLCTKDDSIVHDIVATPLKALLRRKVEDAEVIRRSEPLLGQDSARALCKTFEDHQAFIKVIEAFSDEAQLRDLADEVAGQGLSCVIEAHRESLGDGDTIDVLRSLLGIARSTELRQRIEANISTVQGNQLYAQLSPLLEALKSVEESDRPPIDRFRDVLYKVIPALTAATSILDTSPDVRAQICDRCSALLRSISVDAWNKSSDAETSTAALEAAEKHAVSAEVKAKLADDRRALANLVAAHRRQRKSEQEKRWGWGIAIATTVLVLAYCSNQESGSQTSKSSSPDNASNAVAGDPPRAETNVVPADGSADSTGTYSVPHYRTAELKADRAIVESAQAEAARLETRLKYMQAEIERRRARAKSAQDDLESLGTEIKRERPMMSSADDSTLEEFNAKVRRYNRSLEAVKELESEADALVDPYNQLAATIRSKDAEASSLVQAFNAKLDRYGQRVK
jgi:hypothetical protein